MMKSPDLAGSRNLGELARRFAAPGPTARPIPFWLFNEPGRVGPEELHRQLAEFKSQGVAVICTLPMFDGGDTYLRDPYWAFMAHICASARQLGLQLWIADECGCPSGSAAMTLSAEAGFASVGLQASRVQVRAGQSLAPDHLVGVYRLPGLEPMPASAWSGVPRDEQLLLVRVGSTPGRTGGHRLAQGFGRGEINRLDAAAMRAFLAATHEQYLVQLPGEMGTTITGVFTDEPALFEPPGWCSDLAAEFQRRKGYDPQPHLAALFADAGPEALRFRCDYHQVIGELFTERFFVLQHHWCEEHGASYGGHLWQNWPWGLAAGVLWQPDPLRTLAAMGVPGVDWTSGAGRIPVSELKMAASAAVLGRRSRALIEAFGGLGPVWSFEQLKWLVHWYFVNGIDLLILHLCYLNPDEGGAGILHPTMFWQTPQWRHYHLYSEYVGRLSELVQAGHRQAPVALLYPTATVWAQTVYPEGVWPKPPVDPLPPLPELIRLRAHIEAVAAFLTEHQLDFDFIDEAALHQGQAAGGVLAIGAARYRAVVLPHTTVCQLQTLTHLQACLQAGVGVLACGDLPTVSRDADHPDAALAEGVRALRAQGLVEAGADWCSLLGVLPADLRLAQAAGRDPERNLYYQQRVLDRGRLFFLASHSDQAQTWRVWFRAEGAAQVWDPESGERHALPPGTPDGEGVWLELLFGPFQALAVVFGAPDFSGPAMPRPAAWTQVEGDWTVEFLPNTGNPYLAPHDARFDLSERPIGPTSALQPWWRWGLGSFSGAARYRCTFVFDHPLPAGRVWLNLGRVEQAAALSLNGQEVGERVWRPYRFEISGYLRQGSNQLEVVVRNGLANFLTLPRGDRAPVLNQWPTSAMWSGLLGPVWLETEEGMG
jgi:hypothetical protein